MTVSEAERETTSAADSDALAGPTGNDTAEPETSVASSIDGLTPAGRRRLRRAWLAGGVPSLLLYAWMLTAGRWDFFQRYAFDDFFDLQARAMLDGRLDVPADRVGFEGFVTDGRTYVYFGLVPSIVRMPILMLTDRLDGQLTALSMLLAATVLCVSVYRLTCVLRGVVRGDVPVGPVERIATAGLAFATLIAPPFFLASETIVYHEATLWGLALSVAGFDAVMRWQRQPTGRRLAVASIMITLAILGRLSIALGPLAALAIVGGLRLWRLWRATEPQRRQRVVRAAGQIALAGLVPVVLSMAVNEIKFHQVFGVPPDRQAESGGMGEGRQKVLEAHSLYVSPEYLPTNLWQYFGPRGFDVRRDFPYIDFPRNGPTALDDDVIYDALDWCSSLPATAPTLCVLTVVGLVWAVRSRRKRDDRNRIWPLLVGALASSSIVMVFAYIANRYLNDIYPVVLIPGLVGFHAAAMAVARFRPVTRRLVFGGMAVLLLGGTVVNVAQALEYQRERGHAVPDDWRAEWVGLRVRAPGAPHVDRLGLDDRLPEAPDGGLLMVGDCDGLYVGVKAMFPQEGSTWLAVERGPKVGVHDVRLDLDQLPVGDRYPIITLGRGEDSVVIGVVRLDDDKIRVDTLGPASYDPDGDGPLKDGDWEQGLARPIDGEVKLRITADRRQPANNVFFGNLVLNRVHVPHGDGADEVRLGQAADRPGLAGDFPGGVERVAPDMSTCHDAVD
jgi:hypothetical protein